MVRLYSGVAYQKKTTVSSISLPTTNYYYYDISSVALASRHWAISKGDCLKYDQQTIQRGSHCANSSKYLENLHKTHSLFS